MKAPKEPLSEKRSYVPLESMCGGATKVIKLSIMVGIANVNPDMAIEHSPEATPIFGTSAEAGCRIESFDELRLVLEELFNRAAILLVTDNLLDLITFVTTSPEEILNMVEDSDPSDPKKEEDPEDG